ncbi:hypothetical protein LJB98_04590 [Bacteroidales bacterium OttesenSCG-928-M11]|nr:hypothetical protein [Bacteroidales bacterium OttesenSCG-928-M11]
MKNHIYFIVLFLTLCLFWGCKKDNSDNNLSELEKYVYGEYGYKYWVKGHAYGIFGIHNPSFYRFGSDTTHILSYFYNTDAKNQSKGYSLAELLLKDSIIRYKYFDEYINGYIDEYTDEKIIYASKDTLITSLMLYSGKSEGKFIRNDTLLPLPIYIIPKIDPAISTMSEKERAERNLIKYQEDIIPDTAVNDLISLGQPLDIKTFFTFVKYWNHLLEHFDFEPREIIFGCQDTSINDFNMTRFNNNAKNYLMAVVHNKHITENVRTYYTLDLIDSYCYKIEIVEEVQPLKEQIPREYIADQESFSTNSGIHIGMHKDSLISKKGNHYDLELSKIMKHNLYGFYTDTVISYYFNNFETSSFLSKNKQPGYFMKFHIKNDRVKGILLMYDL